MDDKMKAMDARQDIMGDDLKVVMEFLKKP